MMLSATIAAPAAAKPSVSSVSAYLASVDWLGLLETYGVRLLAVLAILVIGVWLARRLSKGLGRVLQRADADPILVGFLSNIAYFGLLVVVFVAALAQVGVNPASLLAVLGAAGLAIALALKDSLSNFASGVMLIILRPFRAGDLVDVGGVEGIVEQVRIFQTRMRTVDNRVITMPNSLITTAPIINFSARPHRRVDVTVGVGYGDNLAEARAALFAVAKANEHVLDDPATDVLVTGLGESSVDLVLRAWVPTPQVLLAKSQLIEAIHGELGRRGLSIPFPQRDLHVYHHGASAEDGAARIAVDDGDTR